jgi:hypothetical protein
MLGLFGKKEHPERKQLRLEFEKATSALRTADELTQTVIGHAINMTNSMFARRFGSVQGFTALSLGDKVACMQQLTAFEARVAEKDPHMRLGTALFKMWIGALAEDDTELVQKFAEELVVFSRKGEKLGVLGSNYRSRVSERAKRMCRW